MYTIYKILSYTYKTDFEIYHTQELALHKSHRISGINPLFFQTEPSYQYEMKVLNVEKQVVNNLLQLTHGLKRHQLLQEYPCMQNENYH